MLNTRRVACFCRPPQQVELRCRALEAVLAQSALLPSSATAALRWIALPLAADPNIKVRLAFSRCARGMQSLSHHHYSVLPPDGDDAEDDGAASLMPASDEATRAEVLAFRPSEDEAQQGPQEIDSALLKASRGQSSATGGAESSFFAPPQGWFDAPGVWRAKPTISPKLLDHIRSVADDYCGDLAESTPRPLQLPTHRALR